MAEWHVTPDYIAEHWTEELLRLMVDKLVERKKREASPPSGGFQSPSQAPRKERDKMIPDSELFAKLGDCMKVVKYGS